MASIAIVGMACRYPDARSPRELWENALAQRRAFRRIPDERLRLADYFSPDAKVIATGRFFIVLPVITVGCVIKKLNGRINFCRHLPKIPLVTVGQPLKHAAVGFTRSNSIPDIHRN